MIYIEKKDNYCIPNGTKSRRNPNNITYYLENNYSRLVFVSNYDRLRSFDIIRVLRLLPNKNYVVGFSNKKYLDMVIDSFDVK